LVIDTLIDHQYLKDLCLAKQSLLDGERIIDSGVIKDFEEMAFFWGHHKVKISLKNFMNQMNIKRYQGK
jgi:hypothetical protein